MNTKTILLCILLACLASSKMIYMAELFRHGARYPIGDIYDGKQTKPYHGQLTSVGMRQQYLLGLYLGKDYKKQLGISEVFNGRQVEVFSDSATLRCVLSAQAHMAGWFPLESGPQIPEQIDSSLLNPPFQVSSSLREDISQGQYATNQGYQPIPIKLSHQYWPQCPRNAELIAERISQITPLITLLQQQQQLQIDKIRKVFNLSIAEANVPIMIQLYDTVISDLNLGRKMPQSFTEKQLLELRYIENYMLVLLYAGKYGRLFSSPFLKPIIQNMNKVIKGQYGQKKLTVYSGHDTNVAPVLTTLNLTSAECLKEKHKNKTFHGNCVEPVPFAGNIQFQLHSRESLSGETQAENYFVKVRYNGQYYDVCGKGSKQCNYSEFSDKVQSKLIDFHSACKLI